MAAQYDATPRSGVDSTGILLSSASSLGGTIGVRVVVDGAVAISKQDALLALGAVAREIQKQDWPATGAALTRRFVPVGTDDAWLMASTSRGTAIGYKLIRNRGGATGADKGSPWQPLRVANVVEFASLAADPTSATPVRTFTNEEGAQNYAFSRVAGNFFGSYHGGETLNGVQIVRMNGVDIDFTQPASGTDFYIQHSSVCTDGTASVAITDFRTSWNSEGFPVYSCASMTTATSLLQALIGHVIANGDTYTEYRTRVEGDAAEYAFPNQRSAAGVSDINAPAGPMQAVRDPTTGFILRMTSNFTTATGLKRGRLVRETTRTKAYFDFAAASVPSITAPLSWTTSFEVGATGATSYVASSIVNGDFASDVTTGWNAAGVEGENTPLQVTWDAGTALQTAQSGGAGVTNKHIQSKIGLTIGVPYLCATDASTINGRFTVGKATNGSQTTPTPYYDRDGVVAGGRSGGIFVTTQAGLQVILSQPSAYAAGVQERWDNVDLRAGTIV